MDEHIICPQCNHTFNLPKNVKVKKTKQQLDKDYYQKNKEKKKEYNRLYYQKNKEKKIELTTK